MSYAAFLLVFLFPPIAVLALVQPRPLGSAGAGAALRALGLVMLAAFVYTTPWDNYLVWRGVWGYGEARVVGTVGYVPVEEYAFFLLQPLLVGLLFFLARTTLASEPSPPPSWLQKALVLGWLGVAGLGAGCLLSGEPRLLYFGLILAWAAPVLAGLSHLGTRHLWADRRAFLLTLGLATLYLWFADRTAISLGIWDISDQYSVNVDPLGLPVEEAAFFFVTTWLCIQGIAMLLPERVRVAA